MPCAHWWHVKEQAAGQGLALGGGPTSSRCLLGLPEEPRSRRDWGRKGSQAGRAAARGHLCLPLRSGARCGMLRFLPQGSPLPKEGLEWTLSLPGVHPARFTLPIPQSIPTGLLWLWVQVLTLLVAM